MSKIKLTDFIAKYLKEKYNVKHFFMVSGGGAMHLNDSLGHTIPYIANHHEQASAIAAEGYARVNQELAVVNVTTGPGGLNCLNGVFGQWTDSVPVLYISGQVKYTTCMDSCKELPLRQLGDQEVDIISIVKPLTKYAVTVFEPNEIKYHIDKAIYEATTGRFGPVWLNIPMNVQGAMIDESELIGFDTPHPNPPPQGGRELNDAPHSDCQDGRKHFSANDISSPLEGEDIQRTDEGYSNNNHIFSAEFQGGRELSNDHPNTQDVREFIKPVLDKLKNSKRPLIVAGHGIRLSKQIDNFYKLIEKLNIPVVTTFNGMDIMPTEHPLYIGRIGTVGQRAGNFALQNADVLLELGSRNNIRQVSYNWENFGKNAFKIVVDIDKAELEKPLVKPDLAIHCDLKDFIPELLKEVENTPHPNPPPQGGRELNDALYPDTQGERETEYCISQEKTYETYALKYAKELRKNLTPQEKKLWYHLKQRQINGIKFRRQSPIGKYIVDFVSFEKKLIIEIDGSQHCNKDGVEYDSKRDEFLKGQGFCIKRYYNNDIDNNLQAVLDDIYQTCCSPLEGEAKSLISKGGKNETYSWLEFCRNLKEKYSFYNTKEYQQTTEELNPYYFTRKLTENMDENDIFVMGNGSGCVCPFQVAQIKNNQRFILNSGDASMGYDLPAAIGACIAGDGRRTICFTGDGSIMMNVQELETVSYNKLPIKIFVLNNSGYSSIRQTQRNFFNGRMTGSGDDSGVGMPDFEKLAEGFGIKSVIIKSTDNLDNKIQEVLDFDGPIVCEVMIQKEYSFTPKLSSRKLEDGTMVSASLEDMAPFLDRDEFDGNMLT